MKKLYKFNLDCGRMGELEGIFTATDNELSKIKGKHIYFGEVLGKHSEIFVDDFDLSLITPISDDQSFVNKYDEIVGSIGFNPLDFYEEE